MNGRLDAIGMRILLAAASKFHAFHLASQLDRRGHLGLFATTFYSEARSPLWRWVRRKDAEQITPSRVRIFPWVEATRVLDRLPLPTKRALGIDYTNYWYHPRHVLFDLWVSRQVSRSYDLVVGWSEHSLFTMNRARELGVPFVLYTGTAHNEHRWKLLHDEYARWNLAYRLPPAILKRSMREYERAEHVSVVSRYAERTFLERGKAARQMVRATPGVDLDRFVPHLRSDRIFRVVYAGLLDTRKGLAYLLEAWKRLQLPRAELWLIGTPYDEMRPVLDRYAGLFTHKPAVPQSELPKLISQGDVFALPSLDEGFAAVLLQAMACGLPVLTTTNSGGEDVIEEGGEGFVVGIRDSDALAEKLAWFADHPRERAEMGRAALRKAQGYTWDKYGDVIEAAYSRLIARGGTQA